MTPRQRAINWEPADDRSAPTSGRGARTRDAIVRAAMVVFGRDGFANTSMHDIASEAGVATGTAYQYFADKADVLRYLLAELEDRLRLETRVPLDERGRLVVSDSFLEYLRVYRDEIAIYRAWWEQIDPPTEFTEAWAALHGGFQRLWVRALEHGQRDGLISPAIDPEITADLVEAAYERSAYSRIVMGLDDEVDDRELASVMADLLGDGLLHPEHSP